MLLKMATASSPRAMLVPARSFSTSLAFQAPRHNAPANSTKNAAPETPRVRRNPLVGNYIPPEPVMLKPDELPPRSTEHPRSSKPPASSAEVPPNADMPPPPPPPPPRAFPEQASTPSQTGKPSFPYDAAAKQPAATAADKDDGYKRIDIMDIISSKANAFSLNLHADDPTKLPSVRSASVTGRTIHIRAGGANSAHNQTQAFRSLARMVSQDKVKSKSIQQKFHERKGLKRKRLASERWRARFRQGFKATVERVMELKRQGW
ncbi:ribosomal protein S21 [Paramyrothecium foliicola]|nr:ribosomal protein S21 [Paramyrothecium foliicola]